MSSTFSPVCEKVEDNNHLLNPTTQSHLSIDSRLSMYPNHRYCETLSGVLILWILGCFVLVCSLLLSVFGLWGNFYSWLQNLLYLLFISHNYHKPFFNTSSPQVRTMCLATNWSYDSIQKSDWQLVLTLMMLAATLQPCDCDQGTWQQAHT